MSELDHVSELLYGPCGYNYTAIVRLYYGGRKDVRMPFMIENDKVAYTCLPDLLPYMVQEEVKVQLDDPKDRLYGFRYIICGLEYHLAVMPAWNFVARCQWRRPVRDIDIGSYGLAVDSVSVLLRGQCDAVRTNKQSGR